VGPPLSRLCSTIRAGGDGLSAQWWVDRSKAVPVARAARRFAGANPDLATATAAVRRSGASLTPGDIAIERAGDAAAPASAFNDPFDMQFDLHVEFDPDRLLEECKQDFREAIAGVRGFEERIGLGNVLSRLQTIAPAMPPEVLDGYIEFAVRAAIANIDTDTSAMHVALRKHFATCKVLCLSANNDNLLMWSHYANEHRGVVFQMSCLEKPDSSWSVAREIKYSKKMPRFVDQQEIRQLICGQAEPRREEIVERTVLTKSIDWSYEQEWRVYIYSQQEGFEFLPFEPQELSAVYFGCRISDPDRAEISALAKTINPTIELFVARKSDREFKFEFDRA
jgi:hypothetical protein